MDRDTRQTTDTRQAYQAAFARFEAALNGGAATPLHARRRQALEHLMAQGLPSPRDEAWRHTDPAPLARPLYLPLPEPGRVTAAQVETVTAAGVDGPLLVFVDGCFDASLSRCATLPAGLAAGRLDDADGDLLAPADRGEARTFAALNTAFVRQVARIRIDDGAVCDPPVQVLHLASGAEADGQPGLRTPRLFVSAGAGSRLRVVETFAAVDPGARGLEAAVTEIDVGAGAEVEYTRLHLHGRDLRHAGIVTVTEAAQARFTAHTFCLGGALVRDDVHTWLEGEDIESTLNGLYLPRGEEQVDHYTTIEHAAPDCRSHELYKGILGGHARAVFRGKIHVHRVAQQTDAYQSNQNLLLGADAEVTSKPQLEIYADDVKCSHGSTTGQLDADALFYLRARGIGVAAARRLLTRAFADELVDRVGHQALRAHVAALVAARLDTVLADDEGTVHAGDGDATPAGDGGQP